MRTEIVDIYRQELSEVGLFTGTQLNLIVDSGVGNPVHGTTSFTLASLAGLTYSIERRGTGTMIPGLDYSLSNNNQTITLLGIGDTFGASEVFILRFGSIVSGGTEPVTLAQAKSHLRVDFTDDDDLLTALITRCRKAVENYCQISIVPYTVTLTINYWTNQVPFVRGPGQGISAPYDPGLIGPSFELPFGPVPGGITSISGIGMDNSINPLDPTNFDYYVRGINFQSLEIVNTVFNNAVIVYNTGYVIVPDDLVLAILNEIAFRYEARGDTVNRYAAQNVGVSEAAQYLANPYRRLSWL